MELPEKIRIRKDNADYTDGRLKRMYLHEYIHLDVDTEKRTTVMIVTRVIGGWIYELHDDDSDKRKWQPVFVPEQVDLVEVALRVLSNLPQGVIPVRQL